MMLQRLRGSCSWRPCPGSPIAATHRRWRGGGAPAAGTSCRAEARGADAGGGDVTSSSSSSSSSSGGGAYDPSAASGFSAPPGEPPLWWLEEFERRRRALHEQGADPATTSASNSTSAPAAAPAPPPPPPAPASPPDTPPPPPQPLPIKALALQSLQLVLVVWLLVLFPASTQPGGIYSFRLWALAGAYCFFFSRSVVRQVRHGPLASRSVWSCAWLALAPRAQATCGRHGPCVRNCNCAQGPGQAEGDVGQPPAPAGLCGRRRAAALGRRGALRAARPGLGHLGASPH